MNATLLLLMLTGLLINWHYATEVFCITVIVFYVSQVNDVLTKGFLIHCSYLHVHHSSEKCSVFRLKTPNANVLI